MQHNIVHRSISAAGGHLGRLLGRMRAARELPGFILFRCLLSGGSCYRGAASTYCFYFKMTKCGGRAVKYNGAGEVYAALQHKLMDVQSSSPFLADPKVSQ